MQTAHRYNLTVDECTYLIQYNTEYKYHLPLKRTMTEHYISLSLGEEYQTSLLSTAVVDSEVSSQVMHCSNVDVKCGSRAENVGVYIE